MEPGERQAKFPRELRRDFQEAEKIKDKNYTNQPETKFMSEDQTNRMNGLGMGNLRPAKPKPIKPGQSLKRLHRAFDPTCAHFLARALPGNTAGLPAGSLHHVAGLNWMAEMLELVHPVTQEPPVYAAAFGDVEIVGRQDNPEQPA